jgi:hypothetical protein
MANFEVTFELKSYYEDEAYNLVETITETMEADDLDALFEILDDTDTLFEIDDGCVINFNTDDSAEEINIEYVLIEDESEKVVYKDEDYTA